MYSFWNRQKTSKKTSFAESERLISRGYRNDDPLFLAIDNRFHAENLLEDQIRPNGIKPDTTIRNIFRKAFEQAGLEYINRHSFRNTIARHAQKRAQTT